MTAPTAPDRARALRRRRQRERQAVIFGLLIAVLAVASLGGIAIWSGALDAPFARPFTVVSKAPDYVPPPVPCVEPDSMPVKYTKTKVNVFNASTRVGLAGDTAAAVAERGFKIGATDNFGETFDTPARIYFGVEGVRQAYTLAAQLPSAELHYDNREGKTIDLAVGSLWADMLPPEDVTLDPKQPLEPLPGCVPLASATPEPSPTPKAPESGKPSGKASAAAGAKSAPSAK